MNKPRLPFPRLLRLRGSKILHIFSPALFLLLALGAPAAVAQTVTAYQCGMYDNSFKLKRKELQSQKDAEMAACDQKYDKVNNTFTWFEHCVSNINDRYRPAFRQLDAAEQQHMEEAKRCTAEADQKLENQQKQAKAQEELRQRAEQQQQALRTEQFNRELERSNAERDAYNRRAQEDANRRAAQYQAQQQAQQVAAQQAAQAEYQRQQAARQAAAEAEQRRQQNWQQTVSATTDLVRSSRESSERSLASAQADTQRTISSYDNEDGYLARMIAQAQAEKANAAQKAQELKAAVTLANLDTPTASDTATTQYRRSRDEPAAVSAGGGNGTPFRSLGNSLTPAEACAYRQREITQITIPANADPLDSAETTMYVKSAAIDLIDRQCPGAGTSADRARHLRDYQAAENRCRQFSPQCQPVRHF